MSKAQRSSTSKDDFPGGCRNVIGAVVGLWSLACLALLWFVR